MRIVALRHSPFPSGRKAGPSWEQLRYLLFVSLFTILWITPNPNAVSFREDPTSGREGNSFVQAIWLSMLIFGLIFAYGRWRDIRVQFDVTLLAMLGWCLLTVPFAIVPDVSLRRLIFTAMSLFVAILLVTTLKNPKALLWLLFYAVLAETLLKYAFVFGLPSIGRHTVDSTEAHLVGLWRGQYAHKNIAGAVCALQLFLLYAMRGSVPRLYLLTLSALQFAFLLMTGSKTPIALVLATMALSKLLLTLRSFVALLVVSAVTVFLINAATVMTVASETMRDLTASATGDPSFTGRTEIWLLLLDYIGRHPWMGAGFLSYWQIGSLSPAIQDGRSWARTAIYGHQGYLDLAATVGIPGLAFAMLFLVVRPCVDLWRIRRRRNPALEMYLSFWLFGMLHNGTESNMMGRADGVWIFLVMGVAGIRRCWVEERRNAASWHRRPSSDSNWEGNRTIAPHFERARAESA